MIRIGETPAVMREIQFWYETLLLLYLIRKLLGRPRKMKARKH